MAIDNRGNPTGVSTNTDKAVPGLGTQALGDWPSVSEADLGKRSIERLKPGSELHKDVLQYLLTRLNASEEAMGDFYGRWNYSEKRVQAYIDLPDWQKELDTLNKSGKPSKAVEVTIPYSYATIATIVTYLIHTFAGRKPIFQVGSHKKESARAAPRMEQMLQYQADHTRLIKHLFQFFQDGEMYGVSVLRTRWTTESKTRTVWKSSKSQNFWGMMTKSKREKFREIHTVYEGNDISSVDPFMFFPDPTVPMADVNRKGEFVFWRNFVGKHILKGEEADKRLHWVDYAGAMPVANSTNVGNSQRSIMSGGNSVPGENNKALGVKNSLQIDQGSVWIVPKELGLGDSTKPELWIFAIANKKQIIQAERLDNDHGMHPVIVSEPYTLGYGFGNLGLADYLGPTQNTLSWLVNSHITNVRTALNNMFIVDPSMVEMQDIKNPEPGKLIRLKRAAQGQDVRTIIQQLRVDDVTGKHLQDFESFMRIGDSMSAITDNLRGIQDAGGRKTATEVRTAGEAGASRLAAHARLISAQALTDLAEQLSLNTQQYMEEEFYLQVLGADGDAMQETVAPEHIVGDFYFPIHDGTLPIDRVAMLDVWKELFLAIAQNEQLSQQFSVPGIFEHLAELSGAKNIDRFKVNVQPDEQVGDRADAGIISALGEAGRTPGGPMA